MSSGGELDRKGVQDILTGLKNDPYADGKAAKVWESFIGDRGARTKNYKQVLIEMLKRNGCKRILDVACGTGVDSMLLLEEDFEVVSIDASDKMLKYALRSRWEKRKDPKYDNWVIEEANWLTLYKDCKHLLKGGFDAVICLGNSFSHLLDHHEVAIENFKKCLKPGGLLMIDHRNYDYIISAGSAPIENIYYNGKNTIDIKTLVVLAKSEPQLVIRHYVVNLAKEEIENGDENGGENDISEFRMSFYPHNLEKFSTRLQNVFGAKSRVTTYGDFKPLGEVKTPSYYVHIVEKDAL